MTNRRRTVAAIAGVVLLPIAGWAAATAYVNSKYARYSARWKSSGIQERGRIADPLLARGALKGKDRNSVIGFLGQPDSIESEVFICDLGNMGGPYRWRLWVCFDAAGKVTDVFGDD